MFMGEIVFLFFLSMLCLVMFADFLPHSLTLRRPSERTVVLQKITDLNIFGNILTNVSTKLNKYIYKENKSTGFWNF